MGRTHNAIAVGRRSNLSNDGLSASYLRDIILRFFFGHKFEHLFGGVIGRIDSLLLDRADWLNPTAGTFPVGQRPARSLPERWPAAPAVGFDISWRFKAIDARTAGFLPLGEMPPESAPVTGR